MGNNATVQNSCCLCRHQQIEKETIQEKYNAFSDTFLSPIEDKYNLLKLIPFPEYANLLFQFNQSAQILSNNTVMKRAKKPFSIETFNESFGEDILNNFLENKIVTNDTFYNYTIENDNQTIPIFKDLILETYKELRKKFEIYSEDKFNIIKKYHCLALGLIYCTGKNREKMEFFFKMFKNQNNNFHKSQQLNKFLIGLFLIPSCCQVFVRMKLAGKYPFLGDISKEDMLSILDAFELSDIERLVGIFNKIFFKEKDFVNHDEFVDIFEKKELWWMFKSSGIRFNLEKYNDTKIFPKAMASETSTEKDDSVTLSPK